MDHILSISKYGTDLSREEFRYALRWLLDLPLQDPPLTCDVCSDPFTVNQMCCFKRGGGILGLRDNIMNKEWEEMCGATYTPASVVD